MLCRERRPWTAKEDQLLRDAVKQEDQAQLNPSRWSAIAEHVPGRTNKDCRKRWFVKMAQYVVKGSWAPDEDQRLLDGIAQYGTRWSLIASVVQTRNSDQCAKRWTDTLNPAINRAMWSTEADELLLEAVGKHGRMWSKIVKIYFPGRTGLSAKNRYNSLMRLYYRGRPGVARGRDHPPYLAHCKSEGSSSPPSLERVAGRPPSSQPESKDLIAFRLHHMLDTKTQGVAREDLVPPTNLNTCQPFVVITDQVLSVFPDDAVYSASHADKELPGSQWGYDPDIYIDITLTDFCPTRPGWSSGTNDAVTNQLVSFDIPSQTYSQAGLYWEATVPVSRL